MYNVTGMLPLVVIWLALGAVGIVIQAFVRNTKLVFGFYAATLAGTMALAIATAGVKDTTAYGMITVGGYANYFDALFCAAGLLAIVAARPFLQRDDSEYDEFYTLLVSSVAGMMLLAHSNNMVVTFVGVELMSISFYVMAGFFRRDLRSIEAALKYFLLGAFATGFLVYGMALVYGSTASLDYQVIAKVGFEGGGRFPLLMAIGATLITVGFSFKISAFPFHQWAPDVYEGSPTVVTSFMSTAGKAAAFAAMWPILQAVLTRQGGAMDPSGQMMLGIIAAITMLVGNISALTQSNIKRMLAYSSVAHAGYMLMGILHGGAEGMSAMVFYVTAYVFMQMGAFVIVSILERSNDEHVQVADYAGLAKREPILAGLLALFMFSLAGIPPFGGFFGKYMLFKAAIDANMTWLAIVGVISSVISMWFYLGLIVKMYFMEPSGAHQSARPGIASVTLAVTGVVVVLLGILPAVVTNIIGTWAP